MWREWHWLVLRSPHARAEHVDNLDLITRQQRRLVKRALEALYRARTLLRNDYLAEQGNMRHVPIAHGHLQSELDEIEISGLAPKAVTSEMA